MYDKTSDLNIRFRTSFATIFLFFGRSSEIVFSQQFEDGKRKKIYLK